MKVSVIVPVYNSEQYLPKCLESILEQNYCDLEVIVINDGSLDSSAKIIESYCKNDDRIIFLDSVNKGVSSARNLGLLRATGDYVMFVDADDYIDKDTISTCVSIALKNNCDIVKYNFKKEYKHVVKKNVPLSPDNIVIKKPYKIILDGIFDEDQFCSSCMCLLKHSITKDLFFDETVSIGEDFLFFVECLSRAETIYLLNSYYYHYTTNFSSITSSFSSEKYVRSLVGVIKISERICKIVYDKFGYNISPKNKIERTLNDYIDLNIQKRGKKGLLDFCHNINSSKELMNALAKYDITIDYYRYAKQQRILKCKLKYYIKHIM